MSEREQYLAQIDRLVGSQVLHGSESLCKLLRYLAKHVLDHPGTSIKEYQIATEVFGRSDDFDPQLDSMVRVQAGRLRGKLAEYYSVNGADDGIVVELPKGTYVLSFHHKASAGRPHISAPSEPEWQTGHSHRNWFAATISLGVLLALAAASILGLLWTRNSAQASREGELAPAAFRVFWNGFVSGQEEPWVIFSNAAFVGRPETGMRYYDTTKDEGSFILDHYTGVGEVLAVHELDRVFGLLRRQIRVKRGSLFSLDDAKNNNLIFIGSPFENLTLLEIPGTQEFAFRRMTSGSRKGEEAIVNVHPQPGEAKEYFPSPRNAPLTEDYAVVGLVKGLNPGQAALILAGTTTIGTQAAVEFVCRQSSVEELLLRLPVSQAGQLKPFEAVIRVKVTRGVPVGTELVALRSGTL
ncbi:MAG TPA: hypothetical protein VN943_05610 [Candidatus Acidoferrum sp.]|nr:hypothetical protein [Candidatus Acidoferrum sp.]